MSYNYQLDATRGAFWRVFFQISGRIGVLIRHFSMDIKFTKQDALTFLLTYADDWSIHWSQAEAIVRALGLQLRFDEPWQKAMNVSYLINRLKEYADLLDDEAKLA